jgi:hypothetical protein
LRLERAFPRSREWKMSGPLKEQDVDAEQLDLLPAATVKKILSMAVIEI